MRVDFFVGGGGGGGGGSCKKALKLSSDKPHLGKYRIDGLQGAWGCLRSVIQLNLEP